MAKKMNTLKLAQEISGTAQITNRQPKLEMAALYFTQAKSQKLKIAPMKRRLQITVDADTRAQIQHPVKITHLD